MSGPLTLLLDNHGLENNPLLNPPETMVSISSEGHFLDAVSNGINVEPGYLVQLTAQPYQVKVSWALQEDTQLLTSSTGCVPLGTQLPPGAMFQQYTRQRCLYQCTLEKTIR